MNHTIAIGRIVHCVIPNVRAHYPQPIRPAIIVRVWRDPKHPYLKEEPPQVNLQVFTDEVNDGLPGTLWKTSVPHDPTGTQPNTWHWPDEGKADAQPTA